MKRRDDLIVSVKQRAIDAVKAGDTEAAVKYIEELYNGFKPLHSRYCEWLQLLMAYIGEKLGEDAVEDVLKRTYEEVYGVLQKAGVHGANPTLSAEDLVRRWAAANHNHFSDFYVEEDDEKYTMVIPFCGSGGMLHNADRPGKTSKPYPWSFDQAGVTYYCCHEPVFEGIVTESGGTPEIHLYSPKCDAEGKIGHECKWIAYKNEHDKANQDKK